MASKKIEELSEEDLSTLEKILSKEFLKQSEYSKSFMTKHGWSPGDQSKQIIRIRDAVRSEKSYKKTKSLKW